MPRQPQELQQPYAVHQGFTFTTTADTAQNAAGGGAAIPWRLECIRITFIVDLFDLYVEFDGTATTSSLLIPAGTGYSEDNISITTRISVLNRTAGSNGRIRGIGWGF